MSKVPNIYLAIISVDNLCLLQQYKWPEHNQNEIAAINHQTRYGPNFMTILDLLQGQTMDLFLKIYLFFTQIFAGWEIWGKIRCPWK